MRAVARGLALLGVATIAAASTAEAQRISEVKMAAAPQATAFESQQQVQEIKSPALAGVLSWIIPGVGSYYAGHNGHGTIHLGIAIGSYIVMIAGATSAVDDCSSFDSTYDCGSGGLGLAAAGWVMYLVNDVWSIFTAVGDAREFNKNAAGNQGARPGRVVGELVVPAIINLRDVKMSDGTVEQRTGVQLLKLSY